MSNVTYPDKQPAVNKNNPQSNEIWSAANANEVKEAINSKADASTMEAADQLLAEDIEYIEDVLLPGKASDSDVLHKTGDETKTGKLTFENSPSVPVANSSNSPISFRELNGVFYGGAISSSSNCWDLGEVPALENGGLLNMEINLDIIPPFQSAAAGNLYIKFSIPNHYFGAFAVSQYAIDTWFELPINLWRSNNADFSENGIKVDIKRIWATQKYRLRVRGVPGSTLMDANGTYFWGYIKFWYHNSDNYPAATRFEQSEANYLDVTEVVKIKGITLGQDDIWDSTGKKFLKDGDVSGETTSSILTKIGDGSKVSATYLPSYVDDVLEYANAAARPATGETGKIYVTLDNNKVFRWSGSAYVEIAASPGSTDSVTEGTTNKYWTNARTIASVLTGYVKAASISAISATTSVLTAIGILEKALDGKANLNVNGKVDLSDIEEDDLTSKFDSSDVFDDGTVIHLRKDSPGLRLLKKMGIAIKVETLLCKFGESFGSAMISGNTRFTWIEVEEETTFSEFITYLKTAGVYTETATGNNITLHSVNISTGATTQVATSGEIPTLWKTAGMVRTPFTTPYLAAPGLYVIGTRYESSAQTTPPTILARSLDGAASANFDGVKMAVTTTTNLPASVNMKSGTAFSGCYFTALN